MKVKLGRVVTDDARPLDLPPEEVAKRPGLLVIESGELELQGDAQMKHIGLAKNVAYACLAETIVLAPEGCFENSPSAAPSSRARCAGFANWGSRKA